MSSTKPKSAFTFLPQGALIQEFNVAGHNIVLSLPSAADYKEDYAKYIGQTIGRTTNRIKNAKIANLNGDKTYTLAANDGANNNSLHGGARGWGEREFTGPKAINRNGKEGVLFTYTSPDGEEGYPGTVECRVWYTAWNSDDDKTILEAEYEVEFTGDECDETVVGVTNHSYFNLNPPSPPPSSSSSSTTTTGTETSSIAGTIITLGTHQHLELSTDQTPTGRITPHPACPTTEPLTPFTLHDTHPKFDDCFVFDPPNIIPLDTRPLPLRMQVRMYHPTTELTLEVWSSEPAFQLYTGEGIDVPALPRERGGDGDGNGNGNGGGKRQAASLGPRSGLAVEPSRYVNAAGREEWRGMVRLKKKGAGGGGSVWGARNRYVAWKKKETEKTEKKG